MVKFTVEGSVLICRFSGNMDTESCQAVSEDLLKNIKESKGPVVFDLEKVDYVSSMFLGLCVTALKQLGPGNLSIINIRPNVKKVFKIAKIDALINLAQNK